MNIRRVQGIGMTIMALARTLMVASLALAVTGCVSKRPADLVLRNGKVVTVDNYFSIADTVVVRDGRILAVGDSKLANRYQATQVIDLQGKSLLPGFIDSHTHIRGNARRHIDLTKVSSIEQMKDLIRARIELLGEGEWITGYGWSEDELLEQRKPLREDLDEAAAGNPVILTRAGGHSAVANSLALNLAGIDRTTPDPEGGVIERDQTGEATGIIRERQGIVSRLVPEASYQELRESLVRNLRDQFKLGITSVVEASTAARSYGMWQDVYSEHAGNLPRATVQVRWAGAEQMEALRQQAGAGDEHLRLGAIKVFADGGFTGPAAYTLKPYRGQGDYHGYLNMPEAELVALINEVHDAGWQLAIHTIGDRAIVLVTDILSDALDRNHRENHRHFLNHFSMRPPDRTMRKIALYEIAVTQQPNFTYTLEGRYVANLEGWRLEHNNPIHSLMRHGVIVAISSDILPMGPLVGLYAAVTRKGVSGRVYAADEKITMQEAIRGYTLAGAYLTFEESIKGSIEPGKLADLVVLSEDLLTLDPESIMAVEVVTTIVGGKVVFEK